MLTRLSPALTVLTILTLLLSACQPKATRVPSEQESAVQRRGELISDAYVQMSSTGDSGTTVFKDPRTDEDVNISVVDPSGNQLDNMTVIYEHGESDQYEAFFVRNEKDEIVGFDIFLHNSGHIITVEPNIMHRANPDKEEALDGYVDSMGRRSQDFYQGTISCEEYDEVINRARSAVEIVIGVIAIFYGVHSDPDTTGMPSDAPNILGAESCEGQWDWYHSYSPAYGRTETFVYIRSQPPELLSADVGVTEQAEVQATWQGTDPTEYVGTRGYKIDTFDHTIFLGPTEYSDLVYHFRILDDTGSTYSSWAETSQTKHDFGQMPEGHYTLEVYVTDEVENYSETSRIAFDVSGTESGTADQDVGLTPEEEANSGTHEYSVTCSVQSASDDCNCEGQPERATFTTTFTENGVDTLEYWGVFERSGHNTYQAIDEILDHTATIELTFTNAGLTAHIHDVHPDYDNPCITTLTLRLIE